MFVRFAILAISLTLILCKNRQSNEVVDDIKFRIPECNESDRSAHLQSVLEVVKQEIKKKKKAPKYSCNLQRRAPHYKYINEKSCYFKSISASDTPGIIGNKIVSKLYNASSKISFHSFSSKHQELLRLESKTEGKGRKGKNKPIMPAFGCAGIGDKGTHTVCLFAHARYGIKGCQLNLTEIARRKLKRDKKKKEQLLKKEVHKKEMI